MVCIPVKEWFKKYIDIIFGFVLIGIFLIVCLISIELFPGFSVFLTRISELGVGPGVPNSTPIGRTLPVSITIGGIIFNFGLIFTGSGIIGFALRFTNHYREILQIEDSFFIKLFKVGRVFSILFGVFLILTGIFPMTVFTFSVHVLFSFSTFLSITITVICFSTILFTSIEKFSRLIAGIGFAQVFLAFLLISTGFPLLEWLTAGIFLIWMILVCLQVLLHEIKEVDE
ncbi:MAG: DUF998 domain-containing protein [Candidatus Helarchaeota archaeon]